MASVDTRVVSMQFDNAKFEKGADTTQKTLSKLKEMLNFKDAGKGFDSIDKAAGKVNFSAMEKALNTVAGRFTNLGIVGVTVLQNLTNRAVDAAVKIGHALTSSIIEGGKTRALNLEAAKFQIEGLGASWEKVEEDVSYGVKDTAYGLDAAAKVASQLLASQVKVGDEMKTALRSISGVAAMTNSSYEDIGHIYTTVAGNGKLMSEQLMQLSTRGLNAAASLGKSMNKSEAEIRDMVSKGQIDFKTFAKAMDDAFGEHAKEANKTFTGALSNMKAALSRVGAAFFSPGLTYARNVLNALTPVIDNVKAGLAPLIELVEKGMKAISRFAVKALKSFDGEKVAGSFSLFVSSVVPGFQNLFQILKDISSTIKKAFSEVFPPIGNVDEKITQLGKAFTDFTAKLKPSQETLDKLTSVFRGVFSAISLLKQALTFVISLFSKFLVVLAPVGAFILDAAAKLGDFVTNMDIAAKKGDFFAKAMEKINEVFQSLSNIVGSIRSKISEFFSNFNENSSTILPNIAEKLKNGFSKVLNSVSEFMANLSSKFTFNDVISLITAGLFGGVLVKIYKFFDGLKGALEKSGSDSLMDKIKGLFSDLSDTLTQFQQSIKVNMIIKIAIAMGILAASCVALAKVDPARLTSSLTAITVMFAELFGFMNAFTKVLDARTFINIDLVTGSMIKLAAAVLILSFAVEKLGKLKWTELTKGLAAVGALCLVLGKTIQKARFDSLRPSTFVGLVGLAISLNILASAVKKLGSLDLKTIVKGLGALFTVLATLTGFLFALSKMKGINNMVSISAGLLVISAAMIVFSKAVEKLGSLSIEQLVKGLGSLAAILGILVGTLALFPKSGKVMASATAILEIAVAINILTIAVEKLGNLSVEQLVKGLGSIAVVLGIFTVALLALTKLSKGPMAADLIVVATSIGILAGAITLLTPALMALGSMSLESIIKSLGMLAGVFVILGASAALMTPLIPALLGLAGAVALIGVGVAALGTGVVALSAGLAALSGSAAIFIESMTAIILALIQLIPKAATALAEGLIMFVQTLLEGAPQIIEGVVSLLQSIITALTELIPQIVELVGSTMSSILTSMIGLLPQFMELVTTFLQEMINSISILLPDFVNLGVQLLLNFLQGVADNIYQAVEVAGQIVTNFLEGLASQLPSIIQAGFDLMISFLNGLADGIRNNMGLVLEAVWNVITAIIESVLGALGGAVGAMLPAGQEFIQGAIDGIANGIPMALEAIGNIISGIIDAIIGAVSTMLEAGKEFIKGAIDGIKNGIAWAGQAASELINKVITTITGAISRILEAGKNFIKGAIDGIKNGIAWAGQAAMDIANKVIDTIKGFGEQIYNAGKDLIQGLIDGIGSMLSSAVDAVTNIGSSVIDGFKGLLGIASPSKVFKRFGVYTMEGFIQGVKKTSPKVDRAVEAAGSSAIDIMRETLSGIKDNIQDSLSSDITITPVLDLSNVNKGIDTIHSSLGRTARISLEATSSKAKAALKISEPVSTKAEPASQVIYNNYDMTQNNYSPKALSRIDIYRSTRNQFSRLKGLNGA